jgi:hypothetical protein
MLSDAQWGRIEPELCGKAGDPGRSGRDNRLFAEAAQHPHQGQLAFDHS